MCAAVVLAATLGRPVDGVAQPLGGRPSLRFSVTGVARCPSEARVRALVRDDFGYDFFAPAGGDAAAIPDALPREVRVSVERSERSVDASLVLVGHDGGEDRHPFSEPLRAAACEVAMEQLLLRFNGLMHARLAAAQASAQAEATRIEAERRLHRPVVQVIETERPSLPNPNPPTPVAEPPRRWNVELTVGAGVTLGAMPDPRPAFAVGGHLVWERGSIGLDVQGDLPWQSAEGTNVWTLERWTVAGVGCARWPVLGLCAVARGGVLLGAGTGLIDGTTGALGEFDLGLRVVARVPLGDRVAVVGGAEALAAVLRGGFLARQPGSAATTELWGRGWGVVGAMVGIAVRFR